MSTALVFAVLAACTSPTGPQQESVDASVSEPTPPSEGTAITDLRASVDGSTVTLTFTEVADATGAPASYRVRFAEGTLDNWDEAFDVTYGNCHGTLTGREVGEPRDCTVENLSLGRTYELQVIALPSDEPSNVKGTLSNRVEVATSTPAEGLITRHTFTEPLEDGWTDRGEGNYTHGFENGDGYGQANYSPNTCVGCGPIQVRREFGLAAEEVTIRMRYQMSENMVFSTGSTVKKIFFLETPTTNPIYFSVAGDYQLGFFTQRTAGGAARYQGGPSLVPGRTYDVKLYIKLNSVDTAGVSRPDGIVTAWLDGERILHRTDVRFRGEDNPQKDSGQYFAAGEAITGIRWNPTWPNGGDPPAERMWERIYDISVLNGSGG